jgi:uracil DNA glycosylase
VDKLVLGGHSIWTISCCQHSYACYGGFYNVSAQKVPPVTGSTVAQAIERFVFDNERVVLVDQDPWPKNQACAF